MTSFTDMLNSFKGVMSPEEFNRRREEERERRIAAGAKQIFDLMLGYKGDADVFSISLDALYMKSYNDREAAAPIGVEEWKLLVARIIKAGWQCELRPVDDTDYRWTHIVIAAPGEQLPS